MTLYKFISVCDKNTGICIKQGDKIVVTSKRIGSDVIKYLPYPILRVTHKNHQLRIVIGEDIVPLNVVYKEKVYLEEITPLFEENEKLSFSREFLNDKEQPITIIKLLPQDILEIS